MLLSVLSSPVTFITFPIFFVGLIVIRLTTRRIYTLEIVALIGLATAVSMSIITGNWYSTMPYHLVNSEVIENESYHLILDSGFLDPTHITIYKCNIDGLFCNVIFRADEEYYFEENLSWQVTKGKIPTITIFVNDEPIHTEVLDSPSD